MSAIAAECPAYPLAESLDEVTADSASRVLHWRKDAFHAQHVDAQRALGELRREKAAFDEVAVALASTQELAEEASSLQAASLRVQKAVELSSQAAAARGALAKEVRGRLVAAEAQQAQALAVETAKLQQGQASADLRAEEIFGFFSVYQEKLGLRIERAAPSVVQVTFSLLDAEHPQRTGSFQLGLSDAKSYRVSECAPALPTAFVATLVERLNRNPADVSALPAFCCSMRRAFKRALAKSKAAGGA